MFLPGVQHSRLTWSCVLIPSAVHHTRYVDLPVVNSTPQKIIIDSARCPAGIVIKSFPFAVFAGVATLTWWVEYITWILWLDWSPDTDYHLNLQGVPASAHSCSRSDRPYPPVWVDLTAQIRCLRVLVNSVGGIPSQTFSLTGLHL